MKLKSLTGLKEIIESYDTFLVDQWGVMHNGVQALPFAIECMQKIRDAGKNILILSNSGKRAHKAEQHLKHMGFLPEYYDHIVTSGEFIHSRLSERKGDYASLGKRIALWAGQDHEDLVEGTDFSLVSSLEEADFILCTATTMPDITDYMPLLEHALQRSLPFVCGNPDLVSLNPQGQLVMCPGKVALTYQEMGGTVLWSGKPYPGMYERCLELVPTAKTRVVGVGDSLHHDIKGASSFGVSSCLITTGVHGKELKTAFGHEGDQLKQLCEKENIYPTYYASHFQW